MVVGRVGLLGKYLVVEMAVLWEDEMVDDSVDSMVELMVGTKVSRKAAMWAELLAVSSVGLRAGM